MGTRCFHVPHFVDLLSAATKHLLFCPHILPISTPKKKTWYEALGLRPTDQSCHHETCHHLDFVDWREGQSQIEKCNRRILLKERPAPYHYGQQKRRISDIIHERPFGLFVTSRPLVRIHQGLCGTRTSSPSDLMMFPFQFISTHASALFASFFPVVDRPHRMHVHHDHLDRASLKTMLTNFEVFDSEVASVVTYS